jgi:hypothetical protein
MMTEANTAPQTWDLELESKPDFTEAMQRIYAWYEQQIIDRPPVRFSRHNAWAEAGDSSWDASWRYLRDRWFDTEYQVEGFLTQIRGKKFLGETFPIFWPNLGPLVVPAFYGCPLEFGEVTSWASPILKDYRQPVKLDWRSEYLVQLEKMTNYALERCPGQFMVGYSDLHSGIDWLGALRGMETLCVDLIEDNAAIPGYLRQVDTEFLQLYDYFDDLLKAHQQLSATWMGIPSYGKMHIPSCDFSAMISPRQFREFVMPSLLSEVQHMTHNVFHVDGKGVARHLDAIFELPNLQAIQWVQGPGDDTPILQWVPLIKRIQAAGKSVVVELTRDELEPFIQAVRPEGILLCLPSEDEEEERSVLKRLEKWTR